MAGEAPNVGMQLLGAALGIAVAALQPDTAPMPTPTAESQAATGGGAQALESLKVFGLPILTVALLVGAGLLVARAFR